MMPNNTKAKVKPTPTYEAFDPSLCRIIAYNKDHVQFVRRPAHFEEYHLANPNSLKHILTQTILLTLLKPNVLESRMTYGNSSKANRGYGRPYIKVPAENVKDKNGRVMKTNPQPKPAEWPDIIDGSVRWLKGLIMQAYGAQAFDIIKEAEGDVLKQLSLQ